MWTQLGRGTHAKPVARQRVATRKCYMVRTAMACSARMSVKLVLGIGWGKGTVMGSADVSVKRNPDSP